MLQHNTIAILLSNFCIASQILEMVSAETNGNLISDSTMPNRILYSYCNIIKSVITDMNPICNTQFYIYYIDSLDN